jgi:hypothetical protein
MSSASATIEDYAVGTSGLRIRPTYVITRGEKPGKDLPSLTASPDQVVPKKESVKVRVFVPQSVQPEDRVFHLFQLWEGKVIRVGDEDFTAILMDKSSPDNPEEEVVIDRLEVPKDDQPLLRPGAIFYWSIGYEDEPGRPRRRVSQIRLRRLPGWTKRELARAKHKAAQLADLFR